MHTCVLSACIHCSSYKTAIKRFVLQFWVQFLDVSLLVSPKIDLPKRSFPTLNRRRDRFLSFHFLSTKLLHTSGVFLRLQRKLYILGMEGTVDKVIRWTWKNSPKLSERTDQHSFPFSVFFPFQSKQTWWLMHSINNQSLFSHGVIVIIQILLDTCMHSFF